MTSLDELNQQARSRGLAIRGVVHPNRDETLPAGTKSVVLLGPDEPQFWGIFTQSPEFKDGHHNPMDRWSKRVATPLAEQWNGHALFPSDGPPYPPFLGWAAGTGATWTSPVGLLVHVDAGLFISYRCALALPVKLHSTKRSDKPCLACKQPCKTACPVTAIAPGQPYDVVRCKSHMRSPQGADCRENGCLVRRACPVAINFRRISEQSAFHMAAFLKN